MDAEANGGRLYPAHVDDQAPFVRGFAGPVSRPFGLWGRMLSLAAISVALSLHPKIPFLADKAQRLTSGFVAREPGPRRFDSGGVLDLALWAVGNHDSGLVRPLPEWRSKTAAQQNANAFVHSRRNPHEKIMGWLLPWSLKDPCRRMVDHTTTARHDRENSYDA
jgi:hypothetical protein